MRKSDIRKWIHAGLDLLPLLVIPVFAIYTHRHNVEQDTVIVENQPVYYETNEVSHYDDILYDHAYLWTDNFSSTDTTSYFILSVTINDDIKSLFTNWNNLTNSVRMWYNGSGSVQLNAYQGNTYLNASNVIDKSFPFIVQTNYLNEDKVDILSRILPFYTYVKDYQEVTTTYPNDVGSSLMNTLYTTIHNYFDFNHVFNFNEIYEWLTNNIFSGQVPTSVYIAWNVFLYEFLMDLIFLFYALFMFFIDMCTNLIERFTCQARGGR